MSVLFEGPVARTRDRLVALGLAIIAASCGLLSIRFLTVDVTGIVDDFHVYFASSRWVVESGTLYREFPSEYPLLANLWFAVPRFVTAWFGAGLNGFAITYVIFAALIYGAFFYHAGVMLDPRRTRAEIAFILLAAASPVLVQLILLRFDFLLVVLVFYALLQLQRGSIIASSLLFGVAIAAKGYPLVYCLAVSAYIARTTEFKNAIGALVLMAVPSLVLLAVTWRFAGFDGMMSPYLFHARRSFDIDSIYALFTPLAGDAQINWAMGHAVKIGTTLLSLVGALLVRDRFDGLARVMALQTFGLLILSPITSPQFVLWALPMMYFTGDVRLAGIFCGFALFSNFWLVREFGLPEPVNRAFWIANLAFRSLLVVEAGRAIGRRLAP